MKERHVKECVHLRVTEVSQSSRKIQKADTGLGAYGDEENNKRKEAKVKRCREEAMSK